MIDKKVIRHLYYLANRISHNAEVIRNADKPHQLTIPRKRLIRHLKEINHIRDSWSDIYKPSRKTRYEPSPPYYEYRGVWGWPQRWRR
jgi:hypothetical protein